MSGNKPEFSLKLFNGLHTYCRDNYIALVQKHIKSKTYTACEKHALRHTLSFLFTHALKHKYSQESLSHKWQQQVHLRSLLALNTTMDTRIPPAVMRCLVSRVCVQLVKLSSGHTGFSGRLQTSINSLQRNSNTHKFTLSR